MAMTANKQILLVYLILFLFLIEITAAIKCYNQPGIDPKFLHLEREYDPNMPPLKIWQLVEAEQHRLIEIDCGPNQHYCMKGTGCKTIYGIADLRGCTNRNYSDSKFVSHHCDHPLVTSLECEKCDVCNDRDLCNGAIPSSVPMIIGVCTFVALLVNKFPAFLLVG